MAYYPTWRRRGSRRYSRKSYSFAGRKKGYSSGRRSYSTRKSYGKRSTRSSGREVGKLKREMFALKQERELGKQHQIVLTGSLPVAFYYLGSGVGRDYFQIPVSSVALGAAEAAGKQRAYVTGFTLEFVVTHSTEAELMVIAPMVEPGSNAGVAIHWETPELGVFQVGAQGSMDSKPVLVNKADHLLNTSLMGVYSAPGPTGDYFGAPLNKSTKRFVPITESKVEGVRAPHKGKVERLLSKPSVGMTLPEESVRVWVDVKQSFGFERVGKSVTFLENGVACVVGIRARGGSPQVIPSSSGEGPVTGVCGQIKNVRLTVHCRY